MTALTTISSTQAITRERITGLMDAFISEQDITPGSKATYMRSLKCYFNWITENGLDLGSITRAELLRYKSDLIASGRSTRTIGSYLTAVRVFYEWAEGHKLYPNIARGVKSPKEKKKFHKQPLTISQTIEFIQHFKRRSFGLADPEALQPIREADKRDYALALLLIAVGLRTVEVIRADVQDIKYKYGRRVIMIRGKGRHNKDEALELIPEVYSAIRDYLATRGRPSRGPLFTSLSNNGHGERLTTRTISFIAKEGLKAIGINDPEITAHSLRHTAATNLLRAGATLQDAQGMLRHTDPATTAIYTATIAEEKRFERTGERILGEYYSSLMTAATI